MFLFGLHLSAAALRPGILADYLIYSGDCRRRTVHRNGSAKTSPLLYRVLGIFLPLITTNCAVLGVALLNIKKQNGFVESIMYGFGAAVGFSLVLVLFAAMRERIAVADVPQPFKGSAIGMITAGLMSLAFLGFTGLVNI